jgi:hypothetical protein
MAVALGVEMLTKGLKKSVSDKEKGLRLACESKPGWLSVSVLSSQ